ncbi:MAG TPA: polysaccharide deacetylase family protein [Anaerolineaceae bacterium]|nr:polysaccharide deacetylase family protein [Anaerolineaceae bacterium]
MTVPILLYHHINDEQDNRYTVSTEDFAAQMQQLHALGYQSITIADLSHVITQGGELPERPIIITFDDGNLDIYQKAMPIMQQYGYVGVMYIVANRLESDDFLHASELQNMVALGWEIGNHSMTHSDLTAEGVDLYFEMVESRVRIERATGSDVTSFAYPFGVINETVVQKIYEYGYFSAVGLGTGWEQSFNNLYYLTRREVMGEASVEEFTALLPWVQRP